MSTLVIIPCYNEEKRLPVEQYEEFFKKEPQFHFLFVNDGSQDQTIQVLQRLASLYFQVSVLNLETNVGKAEAIRQGVLSTASSLSYQWIGYWDADLATPLEELLDFTKVSQKSSYLWLMLGSRVQIMGRTVLRHWYRHYIGRVFATFASIILNLPVYDTQCGAKIMTKDVALKVFKESFITRWFFDIEIIARLIQTYGTNTVEERIYEITLRKWSDIRGSSLKLTDFISAPIQLLQIAIHYKCYQFYSKPQSPP